MCVCVCVCVCEYHYVCVCVIMCMVLILLCVCEFCHVFLSIPSHVSVRGFDILKLLPELFLLISSYMNRPCVFNMIEEHVHEYVL